MKSREQIAAETVGTPKNQRRFAPPASYVPHAKLEEWDASLPAGAEDLLERCEPRNDRMLVRLIDEPQVGAIMLTDAKPLIGGCRKAEVLKVGPGKWIEDDDGSWRRPVDIRPGQIALIGNWVDLEAAGLALCQEGDVRSIWAQ